MGWNLMWLVAAVVVLSMTAGREAATGGPICDDAVEQLVPCSDFLKNTTAAPSGACCAAVQALDKVAKLSKDYRMMLCQCLKDIATSLPINVAKAKQLPKICHASDNVKFDPNTKCG